MIISILMLAKIANVKTLINRSAWVITLRLVFARCTTTKIWIIQIKKKTKELNLKINKYCKKK